MKMTTERPPSTVKPGDLCWRIWGRSMNDQFERAMVLARKGNRLLLWTFDLDIKPKRKSPLSTRNCKVYTWRKGRGTWQGDGDSFPSFTIDNIWFPDGDVSVADLRCPMTENELLRDEHGEIVPDRWGDIQIVKDSVDWTPEMLFEAAKGSRDFQKWLKEQGF